MACVLASVFYIWVVNTAMINLGSLRRFSGEHEMQAVRYLAGAEGLWCDDVDTRQCRTVYFLYYFIDAEKRERTLHGCTHDGNSEVFFFVL